MSLTKSESIDKEPSLQLEAARSVEDVEHVARVGHTATTEKGQATLTFDPLAERKLRRKIDVFIIPTVAILYLFCFIDRANIGNARLAGLEKDLKLTGYDYNTLLSVFYVSYVVFEIPSNVCCKYFGPGKWLPLITFLFGLFSMCTAFVHSLGAASAVRFLLGIAEAGMLPGIAFYLARWYRKDELAFRLAMYIVCAPLAGAFGGLLASLILKIDGIGSIKRWEQIFLIEGIITCGLAIIAFFTLTDRIETAKFLSEDEKALAIARLKSENVGSTAVLDTLKTKKVFQGIFNVNTALCALMFFFDNVTVQGVAFFTPTIIRTIYPDYSVIRQQLMTVPPYVVGAAFVLFWPYLSTKTGNRGVYVIITSLFMVTGYAMFLGSENPRVRYGATFIIMAGAFPQGALLPAWASINSGSDSARAGAIGTVVMAGNLGGLTSTWSFLPKYAPNYVPGNALNLATSCAIVICCVGLLVYQRRENAQRDRGEFDHRLEGKSAEEVEALGHKHPGFRYRY